MTDVTTAATIIQLAVPDLKLVLDPLLYLKAMQRPKGIPKVIHMTLRSKHSLAPHQILSIISWGWYNKGYALLLYDNDDITAYMQRFYPGFMPSKWELVPNIGDSRRTVVLLPDISAPHLALLSSCFHASVPACVLNH